MMNALKHLFGSDPRQFGMIFALITLVGFFQIHTDGLVLTSANLMNLLNGNAYILVLAIGMVLVIIAGHIDLSVGSVAAQHHSGANGDSVPRRRLSAQFLV